MNITITIVKGAVVISLSLAGLSGCGGNGAATEKPKPVAPAKVDNGGVKEGDLATVTLTPKATERLGIQTSEVEWTEVGKANSFAGEVVIPPGRALTATTPLAGTLSAPEGGLPLPGTRVRKGQVMFRLVPMLAPQRDLRISVEAEVASATTRLEAAKARAARADQMLRDRVGSARAVEDANQELELAKTALVAAQQKLEQVNRAPLQGDSSITIPAPQSGVLRLIHAAAGQSVSAGAALFEVANIDTVWVRVPIYAGDLASVTRNAPARIRALNSSAASPARVARPVPAPPSADPLASTVDLFFELSNGDPPLRPGEKVDVAVPSTGTQRGLRVPSQAIVYDINGGTWVYENTGPNRFTRRRVQLQQVSGNAALLSHGPKPGSKVVTAGAAELFGTEFGPGK